MIECKSKECDENKSPSPLPPPKNIRDRKRPAPFPCGSPYSLQYGNTGCGVFKRGVQNYKGFCVRINILKGNY